MAKLGNFIIFVATFVSWLRLIHCQETSTGFSNCYECLDQYPGVKVQCMTDVFSCSDYQQCNQVGYSMIKNCTSSWCKDNFFACTNKRQCYWERFRCDGKPHCEDGSDEQNCTDYLCPRNLVVCQGKGLRQTKPTPCINEVCGDGDNEPLVFAEPELTDDAEGPPVIGKWGDWRRLHCRPCGSQTGRYSYAHSCEPAGSVCGENKLKEEVIVDNSTTCFIACK